MTDTPRTFAGWATANTKQTAESWLRERGLLDETVAALRSHGYRTVHHWLLAEHQFPFVSYSLYALQVSARHGDLR